MKEILLLDNYDSFTFNLVHYFEDLNCKVTVIRNDEFELDEIKKYDIIVLSPGPGIPSESGLLLDVIKTYSSSKKILGICLGQQAIAEVFGAKLQNLNTVYHGVSSVIDVVVADETLYNNLPNTLEVGRYHSWVINPDTLPEELEVTSFSKNGEIMSIRHKYFDVKAVQFHPESILTPHGKTILANWLKN